jgi:hypothetical protein
VVSRWRVPALYVLAALVGMYLAIRGIH